MSDGSFEPKLLQFYDYARKQRHWMELLSPSQYVVFLTDVKSGNELMTDGTPKPHNVPGFCLAFDNLPAAEEYCGRLVNSVTNARCDVYDFHGKSKPPLLTFTHPKYAGSVPNRRSANRMLFLAAMIVIPAPILFWIDWQYRGVLIVPTLIGLTLISVAFRLLLWAFGTFDAVRAAERRSKLNS